MSTCELPPLEDGPLHFPKDVDVNDGIPSEDLVAKIAKIPVYNAEGREVPFRSVYEGLDGEKKNHKVLVVFIRHFYCGSCQEYVKYLIEGLPPAFEMLSLPRPISIAIIGCGAPSIIPFYVQKTDSPFPIYADPSRRLYAALQMTRTYARHADGGGAPEYIKISPLKNVITSITQGLSRIPRGEALKGGAFDQVGGEFLFKEGRITWCHRMRTTEDHTPMAKIKKLLGIASTEASSDAVMGGT